MVLAAVAQMRSSGVIADNLVQAAGIIGASSIYPSVRG